MRSIVLVVLIQISNIAWSEQPWNVLYGSRATPIAEVAFEGDDLWIPVDSLAVATGFTRKPEGFCSSERCVPVPKDPSWIRDPNGSMRVGLIGFAHHVGQPIVVDQARRLVVVGTALADRPALLERGEAPDFALPDRTGKIVRLSDFRGKKVLLLTWASWCGCSADLPLWEKVYQRLKEKNFELIAVAEDTAGELAAGKFYDRAHATYTTLIDIDHTVTALYQMVNVPTGVWIDEQGLIARPPEVAYTPAFRLLGRKVGDDRYVPALEDWVANGTQSRYVLDRSSLKEKLAPRSEERRLADVEFRAGSYLFAAGDKQGANEHWQAAQKLDSENWNYHRQEWSFDSKKAVTLWMKKVQSLGDKPYYQPIQFPQ
jgi:peroxiredoxin